MLLSGTTFYVLNASDGTVAYSFAVNGTVTYFDWSPLGNKVAYIGNQSGSSFRIYVIDDITIPNPVPRLVSQQCQPTSLAWSPDGTQIVFSRSVGGESVLNIVDANANPGPPGSNCNGQYLNIPLPFETQKYMPAWSPDGSRIAFMAGPSVGDSYPFSALSSLYVFNLTTSTLVSLPTYQNPPTAVYAEYPEWSPDGTLIAYHAFSFHDPILTTDDDYSLYAVDPNGGSAPITLTTRAGGTIERRPQWWYGGICQASMTLQSMESGAFALVPPCQPICVSYPLFGSDGTRPNFRNYPSTGSESSVLISITDPTLALRILVKCDPVSGQ